MKVLAARLRHFLDEHLVCYQILNHERTSSLHKAAQLLELNPAQVIQVVLLKEAAVLKDESLKYNYILAAFPLDTELDLKQLSHQTGRHFTKVTDAECNRYFVDCEPGSYTLFGEAYGLSVVLDKSIENLATVYLEAGCHTSLLQLSMHEFKYLTADAPYFSFAVKSKHKQENAQNTAKTNNKEDKEDKEGKEQDNKENLTTIKNVYQKVKDLIYN